MNVIKKIITSDIYQTVPQNFKQIKAVQKLPQTNPICELKGLNSLASQNLALIKKSNGYPWELSQSDYEKLSCITDFDCDKTILSYVFNHFYKADLTQPRKIVYRQTEGIEYLAGFFEELDEKSRKKIFDSKLLSQMFSSCSDIYFPMNVLGIETRDIYLGYYNISGLNFFNLEQARLDKLEQYATNPIQSAFLKSFFGEYGKRFQKFENILNGFEKAITTTEDFLQVKNSSAFEDLLSTRNHNDITNLIHILKPRIQDMNDKQIEELHSLLKTLLEAKTPNGDFIFGSSKTGDTSSKMMMSGIEKIINAKCTNLDEFKELMQLLRLTKEGEIPPSVIGTLASNGKICDDFMQAVKKTSSFYELLKPNEISKIQINKETLDKLFPYLESSAISQGELGDCYFVSAVNDFIKNPKTRSVIFNMFSTDRQDIIVTIPDAKNFPIRFPNMNIEYDGKRNANAPLGIQMLESAYAQTRALKYQTANKITSIEGGRQVDVYNAFLNSKTSKCFTTSDDNLSIEDIETALTFSESSLKYLREKVYNTDNPILFRSYNEYLENKKMIEEIRILEANIRFYKDLINSIQCEEYASPDKLLDELLTHYNNPNCLISIGSKIKEGDGCFDKTRMLYGGHAYSIKGVNENSQTIQLINPWNTAQYIEITFDEFRQFFNMLNLAEV